MSKLTQLVLTVAALLVISACDPAPADPPVQTNDSLTFGLLPDEDPITQRKRYVVLMEAVKNKTGLGVELVVPASYEELVDLFGAGKLDVAYFGGYTYLKARERYDAVPLVMRDIDARFVSYVLVPRNRHKPRQLSELRGSRFAFGAQASTSGHIMPRYFFSKLGIKPEEFFSEVHYSGAHDRTVKLVADGSVDAGVANGQIVQSLLDKSNANELPVDIIWQSPQFVDYVWAAQPSLSEKIRRHITEAFLHLSREDKAQRKFLQSVGAQYYVPAQDMNFNTLRDALNEVEQSKPERQRR